MVRFMSKGLDYFRMPKIQRQSRRLLNQLHRVAFHVIIDTEKRERVVKYS